MPTTADIAGSLEGFLTKRFSIDPKEAGFSRDVHLWHEGFLDSIALAEILVFIEKEFGVRVPDFMLVDEKLGSINGMSGAVEKLAAKGK